MCGIVGFTGVSQESQLIEAMNHMQKHRGPDDEGYFFCSKYGVHLGMVRLSILDDSGGHQPMFAINQRYCIIFNGEIFNSGELRNLIEKKGYKLESNHSDTEVLPYLYHIYGFEMLNMLHGMFAFALLDRDKGEIFFARDQSGIKPLYYSISQSRFSFASEIKSLKILPWINTELNIEAISDYFSFQSIQSPKTIYQGIQSLTSGTYGIYSLDSKELNLNKYWNPRFDNVNKLKEEDLPSYIREELLMAVNRWSLSDVPIGCSLSGGLDSSAIVACMSNLSSKKIKTYSLGFSDVGIVDERPLARLVSKEFETDHKEIVIDSSHLLNSIDRMLFHLDQPYAGGLPSWFVYQEMAKEVKVGMSGVGGDELFGNYGKWLWYQNRKPMLSSIYHLLKRGVNLSSIIRYPKASLYKPMIFTDNEKSEILLDCISNNYFSVKDLNDIWPNSLNPRDQICSVDFSKQLPDEFLFMTDRFSMAHSLEVRTPMLDQEFVQKMLEIPSEFRSSEFDYKILLRSAVKDWLPPQVINAPKRGFVLPMDLWLKGSLKNELLFYSSNKFLDKQNIFNINIKDKLILPYLDEKINNVEQVWTWWLFQKWWDINENTNNKLF
jgi:asparagine synthase (glutamine-hydrolysing)